MRFIDRIKKRLVGPKPNNPQFEHKTGEDAVRALLQAHPQQSAPVPPIEKRIAATVKSPTIPGEIPKRPSPHSPETIIANIDRGVAKLFSNPMERENVQVYLAVRLCVLGSKTPNTTRRCAGKLRPQERPPNHAGCGRKVRNLRQTDLALRAIGITAPHSPLHYRL